MAVRPESIPDEKALRSDLVAMYSNDLEEIIDRALNKRRFVIVTKKTYKKYNYKWPSMEKQVKANRSVYALTGGYALGGFLDVSEIDAQGRRSLMRSVRDTYNRHGWATVLFGTESGHITNIALVKN